MLCFFNLIKNTFVILELTDLYRTVIMNQLHLLSDQLNRVKQHVFFIILYYWEKSKSVMCF